MADFFLEQNKFGLAEPLYLRIYSTCQKTLGEAHNDTLESAYRLGTLLEMKGDHNDASKLFLIAHKGFIKSNESSIKINDAWEQYSNSVKRSQL